MATMPVWRELAQPAEIADALVGLFEERGDEKYSEVVTQIEHATQCAGCAIEEGAGDATVLAAFLHDFVQQITCTVVVTHIDVGTGQIQLATGIIIKIKFTKIVVIKIKRQFIIVTKIE